MQRDAPIETVVQWMQERFQSFNNGEADQAQFIDVMVESNQFTSKKDAQHYFELLDIDKNGNVSFSELFAPLIPQMTKDQVLQLTAESAFTVEHLRQLQQYSYDDLQNQTISQAGFKMQFPNAPQGLKNALTELFILWPQGPDGPEDLNKEEFSQLVSMLEILMVKKYCLRNYLDSYKEVVNDFTVTLDAEKSQANKPKKTLKIMMEQESDQEFVGKIKAYKDMDFINIRNPEYVIGLIAEEMYHTMIKQKVEGQPNPQLDGVKSIMAAGNLIQRKIQNMQVRLDLLEKTLSKQSGDDTKPIENIEQVEGTVHALQILNSLADRCQAHYETNSKSSGFMMNYQDYLSLNYLLVNHKVLQEEFNLSAQKAKQHEEDKQKYDLAQKKWMSKLQVVAGDVEEELNEVKQDNELLVSDNELMQEQLQKLTVENNVLKDQLNLAELQLNYDGIVKIINSSKKEIENNFENQAQREAISNLIGSAPTVKDNIAMFNKKLAKAEQDKLMKKVSASLQALQAETPTPLELVYQQKVHSAAKFENVPYKIEDILEFVTYPDPAGVTVDNNVLSTLSDYVKTSSDVLLLHEEERQFLVVDNQEKYRIRLFLARNKDNDQIYQLLVQNHADDQIIDVVDLRTIEAVVLHQNDCEIFALKLQQGKADLVIQTMKRTEILFNIISIFEKNQWNKFKLYFSKGISIKQILDGTEARDAAYKKEKDDESNEAQGEIELESPEMQAEADSPAQIGDPDKEKEQELDQIVESEYTQSQSNMDTQQIQLEAHEPGGITDQEIIDQFQNYQRSGTFAVAKDELKDRIVQTLNVYNSVREQASKTDPAFVSRVIHDPFVQALKVGFIQKKSDGRFNKWEDRFLALTNICLLYFKKGEEQPRKFKILNNFILINVTEAEEKKLGRKNIIKIVFNKKLIAKDNYIACSTPEDKKQWMDAFKEFQITALEKRISLFEKRVAEAQ